jgi:ornithine cyclodeaminase
LRDISPAMIIQSDNVVDDVDHVCRAQTSLDLARQSTGHTDFIRATLGEVILGQAPTRDTSRSVTIFSPFGLGILDLALGQFVLHEARKQKLGIEVPSFLPRSWAHTTVL